MPAETKSSIQVLQLSGLEVRQLFQKSVLRREKPPSEAACQRVAEIMNGRNWFLRTISGAVPALKIDDRAVKEFISAARRLRSASKNLRDAYEGRVAEYIGEKHLSAALFDTSRVWDNTSFEMIDTAITIASEYVDSRTLDVQFDWNLEAQLLGVVFDEAMQSSAPNKVFGNSTAGPRLRFICNGLRLVANVKTNEAAIKTRLSRITE